MEMAGISRTIARALRLNEDLTETIALGHDLGHPPFGHSGEDMLDELMKDHGGFDHNLQSLRTVTELEQKYPGFVGLNLTWESREGLSKHHTHDDKPEHLAGFHFHQPSLEAQIADLADEITYYSHDLDDGLDEGLITLEQLEGVTIWQDTFARVKRQHPHLPTDRLRSFSIREIIDGEVADVIAASERNIEAAGVNAPDDARRLAKPLVAHTDDVARANQQLREFLYANLYFNPRVHAPHERAVEVLRDLFRAYVNDPSLMGETARQRITTHGLHRAVCDYLAGMTDRYAFEEHRRVVTSIRVP
jgi:dGTPase